MKVYMTPHNRSRSKRLAQRYMSYLHITSVSLITAWFVLLLYMFAIIVDYVRVYAFVFVRI